MQHTIQQLMDKVSAMHTLAIKAHREKYKKTKGEPYDINEVTILVEQIQALAGDIYNDRTPHPKLKEKME
jgi:NAD kinase